MTRWVVPLARPLARCGLRCAARAPRQPRAFESMDYLASGVGFRFVISAKACHTRPALCSRSLFLSP